MDGSISELKRRCANVLRLCPGDAPASIMLFGSVARGDASADSDIDLLLAVQEAKLQDSGRIAEAIARVVGRRSSVVVLSFEQLTHMSGTGSMFLLHLQLEGIVLVDALERLSRLVASKNAIDFAYETARLRDSSAVLYAGDLDTSLDITWRVTKHLLRRAAILECARRGRPLFSTAEVVLYLRDRRLQVLQSSSGQHSDLVVAARSALADYVGLPNNQGQALAVLASSPITTSLASDLVTGATVVAYDETEAQLSTAA
jgi:predicted nucleotidyltransferase